MDWESNAASLIILLSIRYLFAGEWYVRNWEWGVGNKTK